MKNRNISQLEHPFPALWDSESKILILGSFPSVKSREQRFFYGHPQNRFWKLLASIFDESVPTSIEEKQALLHSHHIALWDVIASCEIEGSSDSSIRNVVANDLSHILTQAEISAIFVNGKAAERMYNKYTAEKIGIKAIALPSTSPANAAWSFERLLSEWSTIKKYI